MCQWSVIQDSFNLNNNGAQGVKSFKMIVQGPSSELSEATGDRLAQWHKRRSAEREAVGSNPGRTKTQGL